MHRAALPAVAVLLAAGCTDRLSGQGVPAVLVDPSPTVRAELVAAVASLTGVPRINLADDALTRSSLLILDRPEPGGDPSRPATGRTLGLAVRLRLTTVDGRCILSDETGERPSVELTRASCRPE